MKGKRGFVVVNTHIDPKKLYPGRVPMYCDNIHNLLSIDTDDGKHVVVLYNIPKKEHLLRLRLPFIIYCTKAPVWLKDVAVVICSEQNVVAALLNVIHGSYSDNDIYVLNRNRYFVHLLLCKNIHKMYRKLPLAFTVLDTMLLYSSDKYIDTLITLLQLFKPFTIPFYVNKRNMEVDI